MSGYTVSMLASTSKMMHLRSDFQSSSSQMKGLVQFILDVRNSKDEQEETRRVTLEINNIRKKFNSQSSLNGYQRKKYFCKLIYIYLMGISDVEDIVFGHIDVLLRSDVFSEKQLGYLVLSIFYENKTKQTIVDFGREIFDIVYDRLVEDLRSKSEDVNCLVLQFICSKFNISTEDPAKRVIRESDEISDEWLELTEMVYSICISPNQSDIVKQKSVLALKTLLTAYPLTLLSNESWTPRLLSLIENDNLSMVISTIPLVYMLVDARPEFAKSVFNSACQLLYQLVVQGNCDKKFYYYETPAPWLTVKLLNLVEHMFLLRIDPFDEESLPALSLDSIDPTSLNNLRSVVARSIQDASQHIVGLSNRNSKNSILFQAVSLAIFLDASIDAIKGVIEALIILLNSAETNTKYLALDTLIKLISRSESENGYMSIRKGFEKHILKIFDLFYDRDISVKRKALDLLFIICGPDTYVEIVDKWLDLLPTPDHMLNNEISVKAAVVAEKYATDSTWYVSKMIKLLSVTGSNSQNGKYMIDEVWERIIQIIVNNEVLHRTSCYLIMDLLMDPQDSKLPSQYVPSSLIKLGAFVLGEYGQLLTHDSENQSLDFNSSSSYSPRFQFSILEKHYFTGSISVKVMILSAFMKFFVKYRDEEFVADILDILEIEASSIDTEIQTRANEYLRLCTTIDETNLAYQLNRPFPVFESNISPLLLRFGNIDKNSRKLSRSSSFMALSKKAQNRNFIRPKPTSTRDSFSVPSSLSHLPATMEETTPDTSMADDHKDPFDDDSVENKIILTQSWRDGFLRMCQYDAGIFYEDLLIKITFRVQKDRFVLNLKFTLVNKSKKINGTGITNCKLLSVKSFASSSNPGYLIETRQQPDPSFDEKTALEFVMTIREPIQDSSGPIFKLTFSSGASFNQLVLKIPATLLKTATPMPSVSFDDFKVRWSQIGTQLVHVDGESTAVAISPHRVNSSNISRLVVRIGLSVVYSTDVSAAQIVVMGVGVIHTQKLNYGLLVIIKNQDEIGRNYQITCRCTGNKVAQFVSNSLKTIIESKF